MSHQLQIHPAAAREFYDAIAWYESQAPGLGLRFEREVINAMQHIAGSPQSAGFVKGNFQQLAVRDFPFVIVYKVSSQHNTVFIASIFHTSRNPKRKFRR